MSSRYLTPDELVARLGLPSKNALYLMNHRGTGPKVTKIGRRVRYRIEDVEAWEQSTAEQEATLAA